MFGVSMRVCSVRVGELSALLHKIKPSLEKVDLVLFSYGVFPNISYEDEITGTTTHIKTLLKLSKERNAIVVCCANLQLFGEERTSVIVCEVGKLLGICDCNKNKEHKEVRVFLTKFGKLSVIIDNDLFDDTQKEFLQTAKVDFVVHMSKDLKLEKINKALQDKTPDLTIFSLNSTAFLYKNKFLDEVNINFCEFFTKDFKI